MGFLTRRDKAITVYAQRVQGTGIPPDPPARPTIVMVPPMGQVPPPPAAATPQSTTAAGGAGGATHNVIYVVNTPPPAAVHAPPQEVHHHHHHTTQVVMPRSRRLSKDSSFLGTLGFLVGVLACGVAFLPPVARFGGPLALVGLTMAALGWVWAVLLRRTHAGMPMLGMIVSAVGWGLCQYKTGQAQATYDKLRARSPIELPAVKIAGPTESTARAVAPTATPK